MDRVKIVSEEVDTVHGAYKAHPIGDSKDAFRAALAMILKHTADMFVVILEAVSDKYGHDVNEMMQVVIDHPKYKEFQLHPVLYDMGYLERPAAAAAATAAAATEQNSEPVHPDPAPAAPVAPKRKFRIKKVATATTLPTEEPKTN